MTRAELLTAIREDRLALVVIVAPLTDAQLDAPGPDGGWSSKHHLSHIAAWERMIVAHLTDRTGHLVVGMDAGAYARASLDELNARLHGLHVGDTIADVRAEFADAHAEIVAFIEAMPESRLGELYWGDDAAQRTVIEKISGDTYLHYREHAVWIGELLDAKG